MQFLFYSTSQDHERKCLNKEITNNIDNDAHNKYL